MFEMLYLALRTKTAAQQRTFLRRCYKRHIINDMLLWEMLSSYGTPLAGATAARVYEDLGFVPFAGFPLERQ